MLRYPHLTLCLTPARLLLGRTTRHLLLRASTVAIPLALGLSTTAVAQLGGPVIPQMPKAEKVFQEALKSTVWIGASRQAGEGTQSCYRTGIIVDAAQRLVLTRAEDVAGGSRLRVVGAQFIGEKLNNNARDYEQRVNKGEAISATLVASDPKKDLAIIQLESLPEGSRAISLAKAAAKPGQVVLAVCASFSSKGMWWSAPGSVSQVRPLQWQDKSPFDNSQLQFQARVLECRFIPLPTQPGGPLVNERGECVGMYWGTNPQHTFMGIEVSEIRTMLRHADVAAIVGGGNSSKEKGEKPGKPEGPKRPSQQPRGAPVVGKRFRPTPKQTAVLRQLGRPIGVAVDYLEHRKIEDDAERAATNKLRMDLFTKTLTELEQRGMEHVGDVAARSAEALRARYIDVKLNGTLNTAKLRSILGREESLEEGNYQLRGPGDRLPTSKPITWYKYSWLQFGLSDDVVRVVRVDCQPPEAAACAEAPPTPAEDSAAADSAPLNTTSAPDPTANPPATEQPRTWTAGNHSTTAMLVAVDGPNVTLRKADGTQVTLRRDRLSREDQDYIQNSPLDRGP